jgi:hypothetical protein
MGALRAAELDFLGMIGVGKIYEWLRDGVTEDDSEVVLNYTVHGGVYRPLTVPLVDIRAGVEHYQREFSQEPEIIKTVTAFFQEMQGTYYMERTPEFCEEVWANHLGVSYPCIPQKELDATQLLSDFAEFLPAAKIKPSPEHLSGAFQALYDRDRRIMVKGRAIPQQHIDSYVLLHNPEYERISWDAANQELALVLCNALYIMVSIEDIERESNRFQQRCGLETKADFYSMLAANGWTQHEYDRLLIQNARIRKLQHALSVSKQSRRNTRAVLDYLRTHQAFDYWALQAAQKEELIKEQGVDDWGGIDLERSPWTMLERHFESEGLEFKCSREEYLLETGFSNQHELAIALNRLLEGD